MRIYQIAMEEGKRYIVEIIVDSNELRYIMYKIWKFKVYGKD